MKVFTTQPFQIVYSLFEHEYLGYLFQAYVVQVNSKKQLTLQHQTIASKNAAEFSARLDAVDFKLISLIDQIQQEAVMKKFAAKKMSLADFFLKTFDPEKGDKGVQDNIIQYVQGRMAKILELLRHDKQVFIMGKDGEPTWKQIRLAPEKASILFHFRRNEENTHYFPTIKYQGDKLEFQYRDAVLVCNEPAWLLLDGMLYSFQKDVDGKKLQPFLNKKFILIPRKVEEAYYQKFVAPLVEQFDVYAKGFDIKSEKYKPQPCLTFAELADSQPAPSLFVNGQSQLNGRQSSPERIVFNLAFKYGEHTVPNQETKKISVSLEKTPDSYVFHRLIRDVDHEKEFIKELSKRALEVRNGKAVLDKSIAFSWLNSHAQQLEQLGFTIRQLNGTAKHYFIGEIRLSVGIRENSDWFDIYGTVHFGEFEIPFIRLKNHILSRNKEFRLPNGQIAIIPEEWFTQYIELFAFSEGDDKELTLRKHHMALINELQNGNLAVVTMTRKLEKLREFDTIEDKPLPAGFKGELRPYQKAGYNWLHFVKDYKFGGCLADDMGLGKTVQTLAMLQYQKENGAQSASLLVMPTSLIYNWLHEAQRFTPQLRILNYTGTYREKTVSQFKHYDLVLTSYGIVRLDKDLLKNYYFDYVILDESQSIKNPGSNTSLAVRELKSKHRLILTGTPVENSTMDLWSQMSFINPGLLGTQAFFKEEFLKPIEKDKDEAKTKKLHSLIKPFILRRHKSQVATELPEKIEQISYCMMTEEQEHAYEETKSYYRNKILKGLEEKGRVNAQFMLLQGLMKLRQIANHPGMADSAYEGESGKLKEVIRMTRNVVSEGHKVLIFSQFVKHLDIVRAHLDEKHIAYTYLDGSTKNRHLEVERFQKDDSIRVFLISLKAGGVGLNLTAADYVFVLDPWWNPAIEAQAVDRAHRIGQQNTVFTYKFITKNTVEEKILALQNKKLQLVTDLISTDEAFIKNLTKDDIENLLS